MTKIKYSKQLNSWLQLLVSILNYYTIQILRNNLTGGKSVLKSHLTTQIFMTKIKYSKQLNSWLQLLVSILNYYKF